MLELSPDVIDYLNNITGQAHYHLYFMKPLSAQDLLSYFSHHLPFAIVRNYKVVIIAVLLFWVTTLGTCFAVQRNPSYAESFLSQSILEQMKEMYAESVADGRSSAERTQMSAYYIQHNTSIAFLCFATGIFLGLGSLYFLMYNGVFLGCIFGYLSYHGLGGHLMEFVTAHAFLELNAIAIAAAAGMLLGFSIIRSWKNYSLEYLRRKKNSILNLVAASALMLFIAALIEGNISPAAISYMYKVLAAVVSALLFGTYFFLVPFLKRSRT